MGSVRRGNREPIGPGQDQRRAEKVRGTKCVGWEVGYSPGRGGMAT